MWGGKFHNVPQAIKFTTDSINNLFRFLFDGNQNFPLDENGNTTYISLPPYRKLLGTDCKSGGDLLSKAKTCVDVFCKVAVDEGIVRSIRISFETSRDLWSSEAASGCKAYEEEEKSREYEVHNLF